MPNPYLSFFTPNLSSPIPGKPMVANNCGAYVFKLNPWDSLKRFLILGSSNGSYYATAKEMTAENAKVVIDLLAVDGVRVVQEIVEIANSNRAPKKSPCLFALSLVLVYGTPEAKKEAYKVIPTLCGYSTFLFEFVDYVQKWGHGLRNSVARFYTEKDADKIAYQVVKYRQRNGWTHRDVLRLSHPRTRDAAKNSILKWVVGKSEPLEKLHPLIEAYESLKTEKDTDRVCRVITANKMTWEMIPTEHLTTREVWEALLPNTPLMALVRNLGRLTSLGIIAPFSKWTGQIVSRLLDEEEVKRSKVHPLFLYNAAKIYMEGHGEKGSLSWLPSPAIISALMTAFYASFGNIEKSDKNVLLALDVSGSMASDSCGGMRITPREASAIMAMVVARSCQSHEFWGFSGGFIPLRIHAGMDMSQVIKTISNLPFDRTDCSIPFNHAIKRNVKNIDAFAVFTDNETNSGEHPTAALNAYRNFANNPKVKLAVWGMTATEFTINDPEDVHGMDLVGFDTASPAIFTEFINS